uniref:Bifunctional UDP-4-amino-4-deoxy-L-arabinose formyltransferase/UDP-glucuronic acid oxidase ArnA n=1 Tax=Candidatus Aschnera chinzeii TaxID=1485666 RepID=A0AAT9G4Z5_9ENTR|nr:MAG: bifunctional UDP-4-amino-4-deoxy-L-arabinose formyltransferase/UDP-glucuronic acid oxidase ArnA [Candidatus Aschnera chinzeii]
MKAVVFAYHDIGCIGLQVMKKIGFNIQTIFTHHDNPVEKIFFSSVAHMGAKMKIPVFAPRNINNIFWINYIKKIQPDIIFSFYYRQIIKQEILSIPLRGSFNLHNSLLPKYRGRSAINWAIINGETETGVTLHQMIANPDSGNIVAQKRVSIHAMDTVLIVHKKIKLAAKDLLYHALPLIKNNNYEKVIQDETKVSYYPRRTMADGMIDWYQSATKINNLIRAITNPYPGAFTYFSDIKITIWSAQILIQSHNKAPGTIVSCDPFQIACKKDIIEVLIAQYCNGIYLEGSRLACKLGLKIGDVTNIKNTNNIINSKKILILGVNGFIGSHLAERLLLHGSYKIYGIDIDDSNILRFNNSNIFKNKKDFFFIKNNIVYNQELLEFYIKKCDIILPLIAIATPKQYITNPLKVFQIDFEENLKIIKLCVKYNKYVIFPSTSEVYGMCNDNEFDEYKSQLIVGPIHKERWIYSVSKQLLDRIIWSYGMNKKLKFTIFRPFNWIGPRLDTLSSAKIGNARVITQIIYNLINGLPITLVDGGLQKRCFTDIRDGIKALINIIEHKNQQCYGEIINIGNPFNNFSIIEIANMLVNTFKKHKLKKYFPNFAGFKNIEGSKYYGVGYQDIKHRIPNINNARHLLFWEPTIDIQDTINEILDFFLESSIKNNN